MTEKSDNPNVKIAIAIIGTVGLIIVALINYFTTIKSTLIPIEATQTAEAIHTSVAFQTHIALMSQTPSLITTPKPSIQSTSSVSSCYKWNQITLDMAGEVVCVYGVAYSHQGQSRIDFSSEKNSLFLIDTTYYYPNLSEGDCVVAEGEVEVFDSQIPFMILNGDLYKCEPWMLE